MSYGSVVCIWSLNNANVAIVHDRKANMMLVPHTAAA